MDALPKPRPESTTQAPPGVASRPRLRRIAGHAGRLALGLIFLAAGVLKLVDPAEFARQMAGYGLIGPGVAAAGAPLLIAFEVVLGVALLAGAWPRAAAIGGAALLALFIAIEAYGLSHGRTEACGCFGSYVQRTPGQVIAEDLAFLAFGLVAWWGLRDWGGLNARRAIALVGVAAPLSLALAVASPHLPIDPWVTRLRDGARVADLPVSHALSDLGDGRCLVAVLDLSDPRAVDAAARLNELAAAPGSPRVVALTSSDEEKMAAYQWTATPAFEVRRADFNLLKPLYRRLPRYFLVDGGRVRAVYDDAAPTPRDVVGMEGS